MTLFRQQFVTPHEAVAVSVPASKSILNRALLLSALSDGCVTLTCGALCEDTRALLSCLHALGIGTERTEDGILVHGCGGKIPNRHAALNVASAGTAARFLPSVLAVCGGEYTFTASEQMQKRPMEFLSELERAGVTIEYSEQRESFPFRLLSNGIAKPRFQADTDVSTQYASGLLLAAYAAEQPTTITLKGARTNGSYVQMTLALLKAFGADFKRRGDEITVIPARTSPAAFAVEGDLSGASYFCALALLLSCKVLLKNVRTAGLQGDAKFLDLLKDKGLILTQTPEGLLADGSALSSFTGFDCDFHDFSDQTATAAVLSAFATTPSRLRNVGHIRFQECDRMAAIVENINALGGSAEIEGEDVAVLPVPLTGGAVTTHGDHRIAMAFALAAARADEVTIDDPACVKKTFENFFKELSRFQK